MGQSQTPMVGQTIMRIHKPTKLLMTPFMHVVNIVTSFMYVMNRWCDGYGPSYCHQNNEFKHFTHLQ